MVPGGLPRAPQAPKKTRQHMHIYRLPALLGVLEALLEIPKKASKHAYLSVAGPLGECLRRFGRSLKKPANMHIYWLRALLGSAWGTLGEPPRDQQICICTRFRPVFGVLGTLWGTTPKPTNMHIYEYLFALFRGA